MKKHSYALLALAITIAFGSCKKDKNNNTTPVIPTYTVPTAYNFTNVNYTNQKMLLLMADQIVAEINKANTSGTIVTAQKLKDMFNNANSYFTDSSFQLNSSGLKLADYCPATAKADLMNYFDSIGTYSQSATAGSKGVAGVAASSANPSKKSLLSPNGVFYSQLVKKTIMGICSYQVAGYLADSIKNTTDNNTVATGSGTAMEHYWDEAFGFFGVPVDFPANTTGLKYFGSYSNQVNPGLGSNASVMNAFLKGRAAISNKDTATKTAQAAVLIATFDTLDAACIIQEMKETDANIDAGDAVAAYGTLSETLGFIRNLKYNTSTKRVITDAQILQLEKLVDSTNPDNPNLYNFIGADISSTAVIKAKTDAIRQFIGGIYGFSSSQLSLL